MAARHLTHLIVPRSINLRVSVWMSHMLHQLACLFFYSHQNHSRVFDAWRYLKNKGNMQPSINCPFEAKNLSNNVWRKKGFNHFNGSNRYTGHKNIASLMKSVHVGVFLKSIISGKHRECSKKKKLQFVHDNVWKCNKLQNQTTESIYIESD